MEVMLCDNRATICSFFLLQIQKYRHQTALTTEVQFAVLLLHFYCIHTVFTVSQQQQQMRFSYSPLFIDHISYYGLNIILFCIIVYSGFTPLHCNLTVHVCSAQQQQLIFSSLFSQILFFIDHISYYGLDIIRFCYHERNSSSYYLSKWDRAVIDDSLEGRM